MKFATNAKVIDMLGLDFPKVWDTDSAYQHLHALGEADSKRTAERRIQELKLLPVELTELNLQDELGRTPSDRDQQPI
jgi:sulfate adenylyltransferase subunit 2